jgi:hypothetical protein
MDSVLNSYSEIGYGIGNHIFNVAGFVSFKGKEYQRFGLRFAFELFYKECGSTTIIPVFLVITCR